MDTMEAESATLYRLLGRHWMVGAPVAHLAFDAAGQAVALALADGRLAIASLADEEPPHDRCRKTLDEGRIAISPRRRPVPPVVQVAISEAPLHLAPFGASGFVTGGRGGQLVCVSTSGEIVPIGADHRAPIDLIAPTPEGGILADSGETIILYDSHGDVAWLQQRAGGKVSALAVSRDGRFFAIGIDGALFVRAFGPRPEPSASFELGSVSAISWSPDGSWLAASVVEIGIVLLRLADARIVRIPGYPANVASLSWSADSRVLLTSGAYRMVAWDVSRLDGGSEQPMNLATGRAGFVLVETVDVHPERPLVGAGYRDGTVVVAKIGEPDELVVKPPGQGAVRALRWSRDGRHMVFGTSDGEAAIVTFPPHIFK
jgi:WD40 repeat protein